MNPIVTRYGAFFLYGYTVWLGLGLAAALALTALLNRRRGLPGWVDGALAAAAGALVGGRLGYILLHRDYFAGQPEQTWQVWRGGLTYYGALLGGLLTFWLWTRLDKRARGAAGRYADLLAPGLALLVVFGWLACWAEGCAFGRVVGYLGPLFPLVAGDLPDDYGIFDLRYQTQTIGALLSAGVFAAALWASVRVLSPLSRSPGALFWLTLAALSLKRAVVALMRGDAVPMVGAYRADLLLDLALTGVSLVALLLTVRRGRGIAQ